MLSAGLAFFAFTSFVPIVLLGVMLLVTYGGEEFVELALSATSSVFGDRVGAAVTDAVFAGEVRIRSTLVAAGVLAWSAVRLFGSSDRAFAAVYGERAERSLRRTALNATLVFLTNLAALTLLAGVVAVVAATTGVVAWLLPPVLVAALVAVLLPMFYVFPRAGVTLREVLPGTVFAAGTWVLASVLLGAYVSVSGNQLFGAASGLLLVLTWLYVGGLAILLGATLNAVRGGHVDPDGEWVPTAYM